MVQLLTECETEYEQSGAVVVAIAFLGTFAALILVDAVLSGFAIKAAIDQGSSPLIERLEAAQQLLRAHPEELALQQSRSRHKLPSVVSAGPA